MFTSKLFFLQASVCGAKGSAHGSGRVQNSVFLNHQLLPALCQEHCRRKRLRWGLSLKSVGLAEPACCRLPWLWLLWPGSSLEKRTCDPEKQGLKMYQHGEVVNCFIQKCSWQETVDPRHCNNLTSKYCCPFGSQRRPVSCLFVHQPEMEG